MTIIWRAKTNSAYTIKVLAELLQNNIKVACFEVDKKGIKLIMMDENRIILLKVVLDSDNFTVYKFKSPETMYLGINLNHLHKMLKSIKKKDSLQLYIDDEFPTDLAIKVIPKENNRVTTSFVKILAKQNLEIDMPTGYHKPIIVPSSEYQKLIKDMQHIGSVINVIAKDYHIEFKCNAGGVIKRNVEFGEFSEEDTDSEDEEHSIPYNQHFDTEQLARITKMSGLGSNIQIYPRTGLPLLFKSSVGSLGTIALYIKSREQINTESCDIDSD